METMKFEEAVARIRSAASDDDRARAAWMASELAGTPRGENVDAKAVHDLAAKLNTAYVPAAAAPQAPRADDVRVGAGRMRMTSTKTMGEAMMARFRLAAEYPDAGREPTGIAALDTEISLRPSTLTVVAGREGAGKSALMLQMASNISFRGPVAYVLTEMSLGDVGSRLVACHGHIEKWKLDRGAHEGTLDAAARTVDFLAEHTNLIILDAAGRPLHSRKGRDGAMQEGVLDELTRVNREVGGFRAVFIDNLWGIAHADGLLKSGGTSLALGSVTKTLREYATEEHLNCPVVLAHHLNREAAPNSLAKANANGAEVGPSTENLGGSDQIGFDAEAVIIVTKETRPEVSQEDATSAANFRSTADDIWSLGPAPLVPESTPSLHYDDAYIHITKNRNGQPNKRIKLRFYGAQQRFEPVDETAQPLTVTVNTSVARDDAYNARRAELPDFYSDI